MAQVQLDLSCVHVQQLQGFTIAAEKDIPAISVDESHIDDFVKIEAHGSRLLQAESLIERALRDFVLTHIVNEHVLVHVDHTELAHCV